VTRPRTALLGNLPRTTLYRNIEQYPEAKKIPGVLIVRVDSAVYFSNSNYIRERYIFLGPSSCAKLYLTLDLDFRIDHICVWNYVFIFNRICFLILAWDGCA